MAMATAIREQFLALTVTLMLQLQRTLCSVKSHGAARTLEWNAPRLGFNMDPIKGPICYDLNSRRGIGTR